MGARTQAEVFVAQDEQDEDFYNRADAHIRLSNEQCDEAGRGRVSASMLYASARFNAWLSAIQAGSQAQMQQDKEQIVGYFVTQYTAMLVENLDDYIENYAAYLQGTTES